MYDSELALIIIPYSVIFLVGVLGNVITLACALFLLKSLKPQVLVLGNTFIYVVAISMVDTMVIISIPFHMLSNILQTWLFGQLACKIYWILEMSNKVFSTFILTAMAFDRYMGICYPGVIRVHRSKQTVLSLIGLLLIAFALLSPIIYSAKVARISHGDKNVQIDGRETISDNLMCVDGMDRSTRTWMLCCIFIFGFALPGTLITFFCSNIIVALRRQKRVFSQTRLPVRRMSRYALIVSVFYFTCQSPFWLAQIYGTLSTILNAKNSERTLLIMYICHMPPFIAAASNWILSIQMNAQFRKAFALARKRLKRKQHVRIETTFPMAAAMDYTSFSWKLLLAADVDSDRARSEVKKYPRKLSVMHYVL